MNHYRQKVEELGGKFVYASSGEVPPIVTEENTRLAETEIGYPLPADYKEFLREFGGFSFDGLVELPVLHWSSVSLDTFYGLNMGGHLNLLHTRRSMLDMDSITWDMLPIAHDNAGNNICLFLSGEHRGSIYFWPFDQANIPFTYPEDYFISSSFDAFLRSLQLV